MSTLYKPVITAALLWAAIAGGAQGALTDGLVSYWKMDEASGNAVDAVGAHNLTDMNTVQAGTGKLNGARDFEKDNSEYFTVSDHADFSPGDTSFTFALWLKAESNPVTSANVLGKGDNSNAEYYFQRNANGKLYWVVFGSAGYGTATYNQTSSAISDGTWYHVIFDHDHTANETHLYVDNGSALTQSHSAGIYDTTGNFQISTHSIYNQYFDGLIDEVGYWNRILTSDERTALYGSGTPPAYPFSGGGGGALPVILHHLRLMGAIQPFSRGFDPFGGCNLSTQLANRN